MLSVFVRILHNHVVLIICIIIPRQMVCATNANDAVSTTLNTGLMKTGENVETVSPAMDIQVSVWCAVRAVHCMGAPDAPMLLCSLSFYVF